MISFKVVKLDPLQLDEACVGEGMSFPATI